jgi:hypothetical protein
VPTVPPLALTDAERGELERRGRAHTTPQRTPSEPGSCCWPPTGSPNRQIAPMVGMNEHTVAQWRRRFETERLAGLQDRKRPGRPLAYDHDQRLRLVATVTQQPPDPASPWSHSQLARALADIGMVELFFSILARRLLKRGEFRSVDDLVAKVMAFIDDYNRTATPFRWTYDGRPLKAS